MSSIAKKMLVLVTGGHRGIGLSISKLLLERGHEVVSLSLEEGDFHHPMFHSYSLDLMNREQTAKTLTELNVQYAFDAFVHNAGVIRPSLVEDVKLSDFDDLVELHLISAIQILKTILPNMKKNKFGRVVLISSRAIVGLPTRTSYSGTKSAMIGMAKTWALELAKDGIVVNVVAPGPIKTDMFYDVVEKNSKQEIDYAKSIPVQRLGDSEDVARAVDFFISPENSFVTGQTLYVCGGTSIGILNS
jgi:NAD(P)-dependent dehydrogenase (short-subunit alcohol dehydrogenase family)